MQSSPTESRGRVKGETPLRGQGAAPLGFPQSTRGRSMQKSPTQSRERESRGSKTLWRGQGAVPLASPLYTKNSYFPCKSTKFEPEFRLNSGGFFFECVLYYMNEGSVRCKTDRNQTPPFRNDDAGEVGIVGRKGSRRWRACNARPAVMESAAFGKRRGNAAKADTGRAVLRGQFSAARRSG